jgi:hypothetical protein
MRRQRKLSDVMNFHHCAKLCYYLRSLAAAAAVFEIKVMINSNEIKFQISLKFQVKNFTSQNIAAMENFRH